MILLNGMSCFFEFLFIMCMMFLLRLILMVFSVMSLFMCSLFVYISLSIV